MSSSDRRAFLSALAVLPLAACGFRPLHAPENRENSLRGKVQAEAPENARQFRFVARFEDRIGRAAAPLWTLRYEIALRQLAVGVTPDNVTTRYNLSGRLSWSLLQVGGEEAVLSGVIENFTSYSATGTTVAVRTARQDAENRLMIILADQLVAQLFAQSEKLAP